MKVLICDDEMFVRVSLKSMFLELPFDIDIVGEAKNGIEAMQLIEEHLPDVVFVDIRMPKLNGLEMIRQVKEKYPSIYFIILSGFSEFEYAKEAITLGTFEYLLKPVEPGQLEKVMSKLISQYKEKVQRKNQNFKRDFLTYYHEEIPVATQGLSGLNFISLIYTVDTKDRIRLEETVKLVEEKLHSYMEHLESLVILNANLKLGASSYAVIIGYDDEKSKGKRAHETLEKIKFYIHTLTCETYKITSLMMAHNTLSESKVFLKKYSKLLNNRYLLGLGTRYTPTDFKGFENNKTSKQLSEQITELILAYKLNNPLALDKYLKLITCKETVKSIQEMPKLQEKLIESIFFTMGTQLEKDPTKWAEQFKEKRQNETSTAGSSSKYVETIKEYVRTYYMEEISVASIAEKLNVTPNYLSSMFHKATGIKLIQFIKQVRIDKAKELLTTTEYCIKEVAEQVGYYSVRHFTKIFTELVGVYPSDYRKNK